MDSLNYGESPIQQAESDAADAADAAAVDAAIAAEIGSSIQAYDADLDALAALDGTAGYLVKTGAAAYARRTLQAGTGVTVSNPAGTAGDSTIALSAGAQASLALADTSSQPGDNVSDFVNDAGYGTGSGSVTSVDQSVVIATNPVGVNLSESGGPIVAAGTLALAITPWWIQKESVDLGETMTIPAGKQAYFVSQLRNAGTIDNRGRLGIK